MKFFHNVIKNGKIDTYEKLKKSLNNKRINNNYSIKNFILICQKNTICCKYQELYIINFK